MDDDKGFIAWVIRQLLKISRPNTPRWYTVELEKGVSVANRGDEEAIASLKHHPGFLALQNRLTRQKAVLTAKLTTTRHTDIRDVDYLVSGIYWIGFIESEVNTATGNIQNRKVPQLVVNELEEFERARAAIEGIKSQA